LTRECLCHFLLAGFLAGSVGEDLLDGGASAGILSSFGFAIGGFGGGVGFGEELLFGHQSPAAEFIAEQSACDNFAVDINFCEVFDEESEIAIESCEEVIDELHLAEGGFTCESFGEEPGCGGLVSGFGEEYSVHVEVARVVAGGGELLEFFECGSGLSGASEFECFAEDAFEEFGGWVWFECSAGFEAVFFDAGAEGALDGFKESVNESSVSGGGFEGGAFAEVIFGGFAEFFCEDAAGDVGAGVI
jgi:hypothetical protein